MNATLYTLAVDGYPAEITDLTFPLLRSYARKIGAEFHVISERQHRDWPAPMEKLQIYQLAQERGDDWAFFLDADALVHPDTPNLLAHLRPDTVMHHGTDVASVRWTYDQYFRRDGRHIGSGNWLAIAHRDCLDLWHPPRDITPEQVRERIHPTVDEVMRGVDRAHLSDDFILSRNIARFGLKVDTVLALCARLNIQPVFFWHQYAMPTAEKVTQLKATLVRWGVRGAEEA